MAFLVLIQRLAAQSVLSLHRCGQGLDRVLQLCIDLATNDRTRGESTDDRECQSESGEGGVDQSVEIHLCTDPYGDPVHENVRRRATAVGGDDVESGLGLAVGSVEDLVRVGGLGSR